MIISTVMFDAQMATNQPSVRAPMCVVRNESSATPRTARGPSAMRGRLDGGSSLEVGGYGGSS